MTGLLLLPFLAVFMAAPVAAAEVDTRSFAGGTLTITETDEGERILAFDGRELARDYFVVFDRGVTVSGDDVLLYAAGPGGNACGPDAVIVLKPQNAAVRAERFGDCGAPPAAADGSRLVFVPWPLPGETVDVTQWTPEEGFRVAGALSFRPQPKTGWTDLAKNPVGHPMDFFSNESFYAEAARLLGPDLASLATSLGTSSGPEDVGRQGLFVARGCVPHACGVADGFVAVDPAGKAAWFAQMQDNGGFRHWPALNVWPPKVRQTFDKTFAE